MKPYKYVIWFFQFCYFFFFFKHFVPIHEDLLPVVSVGEGSAFYSYSPWLWATVTLITRHTLIHSSGRDFRHRGLMEISIYMHCFDFEKHREKCGNRTAEGHPSTDAEKKINLTLKIWVMFRPWPQKNRDCRALCLEHIKNMNVEDKEFLLNFLHGRDCWISVFSLFEMDFVMIRVKVQGDMCYCGVFCCGRYLVDLHLMCI